MFPRLILLFALFTWGGCSQGPSDTTTGAGPSSTEPGLTPEALEASNSPHAKEEFAGPHRLTLKHLPNPVQVHPKVISGGLPEGDAAFQELKDLGVKTVISVDGMKPDVELASKYDLRYVHLPHGYDGIPEQRVQELAKAVRDLEGPIYIHCHHGKHRSPAAASVACVTAGFISIDQGLQVLKIAGTNPNYRGLFESAQAAHPLDVALLEELQVAFPSSAPVPPMAEAMVAIGHAHEHLKRIEESGWKTPADHPDLVPAHEALILREHFTEMLRTDEVLQQSEEFRQMLKASETAAQQLEDELLRFASNSESTVSTDSLSKLSVLIGQNCKNCHQEFRDVPLSEKPSKH